MIFHFKLPGRVKVLFTSTLVYLKLFDTWSIYRLKLT